MADNSAASGELQGKVAIVTGGARGIGRATCVGLARAGAEVAILDREIEEAARVSKLLSSTGYRAESLYIDLSELDEIPRVVDSVLEKFGRIDILVNCAGIPGQQGTLLDIELLPMERVLRVDLVAPILMMQACARAMIAAGRGGRIVNVSSSAGFRGARGERATQLDYSAAKAGIVGASRSAAGHLAEHDINVNCVAPGVTAPSSDTPGTMTERMDPAERQRMVDEGACENFFHRLSMPEDVAAAIVFLCLPGSRQITGQTIHTSAGNVL